MDEQLAFLFLDISTATPRLRRLDPTLDRLPGNERARLLSRASLQRPSSDNLVRLGVDFCNPIVKDEHLVLRLAARSFETERVSRFTSLHSPTRDRAARVRLFAEGTCQRGCAVVRLVVFSRANPTSNVALENEAP